MIKIKPIIPKRAGLNPKLALQAVERGLADAKDGVLEDFHQTTATWNHQPDFIAKQQKDGWLIGTKDGVWNMLEKGTRPHIIIAHGRALRFLGGPYRAKTRPGFIGSRAGGSSGDPVFRKQVRHPGTKPRGWAKLVAKKWRSRLAQIIQKHIGEALR